MASIVSASADRVMKALLPLLLTLVLSACSSATPTDIALPGERAFPENVIADVNGDLYVSNIAEGGVLRIRGGRVETFIAPGAAGSGSTFGIAPHPSAGLLRVCSNDLSSYGLAGSGTGESVLVSFDLNTGEHRGGVPLPGDAPATCNDMAIAADDSVYVTDTAQSRLLVLHPGEQHLEVLASDPRFADPGGGLDGIAIGEDGHLYVNTYASGKLFRVEIENGRAGRIAELTLSQPLGIADGMRHEGGDRFLVVGKTGLYRLTIESDNALVTPLRPDMNEPTGVAIVGTVAFVAEGQFSHLSEDRRKANERPRLPFMLRVVSLSPPSP